MYPSFRSESVLLHPFLCVSLCTRNKISTKRWYRLTASSTGHYCNEGRISRSIGTNSVQWTGYTYLTDLAPPKKLHRLLGTDSALSHSYCCVCNFCHISMWLAQDQHPVLMAGITDSINLCGGSTRQGHNFDFQYPTIYVKYRTPSINAQCRSKSWHWSEMPLNASQFGIERNWSALIDIGIKGRILIRVGYWSKESWM